MQPIIFHYQLKPGGIRRIVEPAALPLARPFADTPRRVVLLLLYSVGLPLILHP